MIVTVGLAVICSVVVFSYIFASAHLLCIGWTLLHSDKYFLISEGILGGLIPSPIATGIIPSVGGNRYLREWIPSLKVWGKFRETIPYFKGCNSQFICAFLHFLHFAFLIDYCLYHNINPLSKCMHFARLWIPENYHNHYNNVPIQFISRRNSLVFSSCHYLCLLLFTSRKPFEKLIKQN